MQVPLPRQPAGPPPQTLLVPGGPAELEMALRRVAQAGWEAWGVARTPGPAWRVVLGRRD